MKPGVGWLSVAAGGLACCVPAGISAQEATHQSSPERRVVAEKDWGPWLGPFRQKLVPSLMQDFGERYLYMAANKALGPPRKGEQRVVFIGDSITDRWDLNASFPGKPYVNRGIGSQVTSQMLLRFHQDVISLKPKVVVILAGINDLQGFLQHETAEQIETNWEALADLASAHDIEVVFGSLLPVNNYSAQAKNVAEERPPAAIRKLNAWLSAFCAAGKCTYADYHGVLVDDNGMMRRAYSEDGVHPVSAAYARMTPVAERAIASALARRRGSARPEQYRFSLRYRNGAGKHASVGSSSSAVGRSKWQRVGRQQARAPHATS